MKLLKSIAAYFIIAAFDFETSPDEKYRNEDKSAAVSVAFLQSRRERHSLAGKSCHCRNNRRKSRSKSMPCPQKALGSHVLGNKVPPKRRKLLKTRLLFRRLIGA